VGWTDILWLQKQTGKADSKGRQQNQTAKADRKSKQEKQTAKFGRRVKHGLVEIATSPPAAPSRSASSA
jgi:hypothetical protein